MSFGGIKITAADRNFSKALRMAHPICEICGWREANQLMHIKGRGNHSTRYSVDNALAGCFTCHRWQEQNGLDFSDWFNDKWPGRKDRIDLKARGYLKNNAFNRKLISAHYRAQIKLLEANPDHPLESWN
jgi:hypothetical protein